MVCVVASLVWCTVEVRPAIAVTVEAVVAEKLVPPLVAATGLTADTTPLYGAWDGNDRGTVGFEENGSDC